MALPPPVPHPTLVNHQGIIEHPNGSDGWLPAENLVPPPSPPHRSTTGTLLKRKSIIRAPSTSRKGINGDVNTPPVLSDEELQNRAVSANHNLTPKQRSRIAKSEGQSIYLEEFSVFPIKILFSKGWETSFQNNKAGRNNWEEGFDYRHRRTRRTSKASTRCHEGLFFYFFFSLSFFLIKNMWLE